MKLGLRVGHLRNHGLKIFFLIAPFPVICLFVFQGPYTYSVLYNDLLADLKIEDNTVSDHMGGSHPLASDH